MTREERLARDRAVNPVLFYRPRDEWGVFSNFSPHPVTMIHPWSEMPTTYPTSEHRYQAMKAISREHHDYVGRSGDAAESKVRGREITLREDWDDACFDVMVEVVAAKAHQHEEMSAALLRTGVRHIYEDSPRDAIWGWRSGEDHDGKNLLGEALMFVRATIPPPPWEQTPCAGCGESCWAANGTAFEVKTALGNCVLRTHRGECEDLAIRGHREQPVRRITPPQSR